MANRKMDYTALFFLLNLTTTHTTSLHHYHCNSDVYSPASGMADLQQLTTLYNVVSLITVPSSGMIPDNTLNQGSRKMSFIGGAQPGLFDA